MLQHRTASRAASADTPPWAAGFLSMLQKPVGCATCYRAMDEDIILFIYATL